MRNLNCNNQIFLESEKRIKDKKTYWVYKFKDGDTKRVLSFLKFGDKLEENLQKNVAYIVTGKLNNIYGHLFAVIEKVKIDKKNNKNQI